MQSHEIHNLDIYTQYLVALQAFNPEGLGPQTTVMVMTDEGGELNFDIIILLNLTRRTLREMEHESGNGNLNLILLFVWKAKIKKKTIWGI